VDLMDLPDLLGIEQVRHWDDNKEQKIEKWRTKLTPETIEKVTFLDTLSYKNAPNSSELGRWQSRICCSMLCLEKSSPEKSWANKKGFGG
jgi:hypothetical protein